MGQFCPLMKSSFLIWCYTNTMKAKETICFLTYPWLIYFIKYASHLPLVFKEMGKFYLSWWKNPWNICRTLWACVGHSPAAQWSALYGLHSRCCKRKEEDRQDRQQIDQTVSQSQAHSGCVSGRLRKRPVRLTAQSLTRGDQVPRPGFRNVTLLTLHKFTTTHHILLQTKYMNCILNLVCLMKTLLLLIIPRTDQHTDSFLRAQGDVFKCFVQSQCFVSKLKHIPFRVIVEIEKD